LPQEFRRRKNSRSAIFLFAARTPGSANPLAAVGGGRKIACHLAAAARGISEVDG
jgi:hypothetical protein